MAGAPQQVAAEVVAFQPVSYRHFVTVNQGTRDALRQGLAAMSGGVLVGRFAVVCATPSNILLVTAPGFTFAAHD